MREEGKHHYTAPLISESIRISSTNSNNHPSNKTNPPIFTVIIVIITDVYSAAGINRNSFWIFTFKKMTLVSIHWLIVPIIANSGIIEASIRVNTFNPPIFTVINVIIIDVYSTAGINRNSFWIFTFKKMTLVSIHWLIVPIIANSGIIEASTRVNTFKPKWYLAGEFNRKTNQFGQSSKRLLLEIRLKTRN